MSGARRVFFDTNVLVYQFDSSAPGKRTVAMTLIEQHLRDRRGCISTQVVQEFLNVALAKFENVLPSGELRNVSHDLLEPLCQTQPSMPFYERALGLYGGHSLSFYDALIIQAALDLDCVILYSEDLQDGRKFGQMIIKNPFKER